MAKQLLLWSWTGSWRYDFPDFFPTDYPDIKVDPSLFPQPKTKHPQTQAVGPHLGRVGGSCPPPCPHPSL